MSPPDGQFCAILTILIHEVLKYFARSYYEDVQRTAVEANSSVLRLANDTLDRFLQLQLQIDEIRENRTPYNNDIVLGRDNTGSITEYKDSSFPKNQETIKINQKVPSSKECQVYVTDTTLS